MYTGLYTVTLVYFSLFVFIVYSCSIETEMWTYEFVYLLLSSVVYYDSYQPLSSISFLFKDFGWYCTSFYFLLNGRLY